MSMHAHASAGPGFARRSLVRALALVAALLLFPGSSAAEALTEDEFPVRSIDRPTSLPAGFARFDAFAALNRADALDLGLGVGGGYGVTSKLELGAVLFQADLAPSVQIANSLVYGLYRLQVLRVLTIAPQLRLSVPIRKPFELSLGGEADLRLSRPIQLVARPFYNHAFGPDPVDALTVPLIVRLQLAERLLLAPFAGVTILHHPLDIRRDQSLHGVDDYSWILGLEADYTLGHRPGWLTELALLWQWPALLVSAHGQTVFNSDEWSLVFAVRVYGQP